MPKGLSNSESDYFFFAALTLAHRARAAAAIFARDAALILRLLVGGFAVELPLVTVPFPNRSPSFFCKLSILS